MKGEEEMANLEKSEKEVQASESHDDIDLRGTLISVSIVGLVILVSWLGVWYLFVTR